MKYTEPEEATQVVEGGQGRFGGGENAVRREVHAEVIEVQRRIATRVARDDDIDEDNEEEEGEAA